MHTLEMTPHVAVRWFFAGTTPIYRMVARHACFKDHSAPIVLNSQNWRVNDVSATKHTFLLLVLDNSASPK